MRYDYRSKSEEIYDFYAREARMFEFCKWLAAIDVDNVDDKIKLLHEIPELAKRTLSL